MYKSEFTELCQSIKDETSPEKLLVIWKSLPDPKPENDYSRESFITNMVAPIFVSNDNTPFEVLKDIISNNIRIGRMHPNLNGISIETLEEFCSTDNSNYWMVLSHKDITPEKLDAAAFVPQWGQISYIIENDNVWPETLDKIVRRSEAYGYDMLRHPKLWPETLDYIAKKYPRRYGVNVAGHPNTSEKTLLYLYTKNIPEINLVLLTNPNTPELICKDIEDMFMSQNEEEFLRNRGIGISVSTDKLFKKYATLVNIYEEEDSEGLSIREYDSVAALIRMNKDLLDSTIALYNNASLFNHPGDLCWQLLSDEILDKMNTASNLIHNKNLDEYLNSRD